LEAAPVSVEIRARRLRLAYDKQVIVDELDLDVPPGRITAVVGANACGKSTLLRGLARLLRPTCGAVLLDGRAIHGMPTRQVARRVGILPQSPIAPEGITVRDLVARGRAPHQDWWRLRSSSDEAAITGAMTATGTADLAGRCVDELSGGQRQRVWIAMAMAQETPVLLLDEPTTFLDLSHQIDVLDLVLELNRRDGRTIVMVLHDLNLACRYAGHMVAMKQGKIVAQGDPVAVVTSDLVADVFGLACQVIDDPVSGTPLVIPIGRHHTAPSLSV
jgi:iron complex transport system ATP-binding protein